MFCLSIWWLCIVVLERTESRFQVNAVCRCLGVHTVKGEVVDVHGFTGLSANVCMCLSFLYFLFIYCVIVY